MTQQDQEHLDTNIGEINEACDAWYIEHMRTSGDEEEEPPPPFWLEYAIERDALTHDTTVALIDLAAIPF